MVFIDQVKIKNSSGKITGYIEISEDKIKIVNGDKPILEIEDKELIKKIIEKDKSMIIKLYDDYTMTNSEIAALYKISYHNMNKYINSLEIKTLPLAGRRNSSYGKIFSEERRKNISESLIGKLPTYYERTPEIRQKISETLKEGYESGRIKVNSKAISQAWYDGKYSNAKMGRGIQGYIHTNKSIRDTGDLYFRSLLELNFILLTEEDDSIQTIINEPVHIRLDNNSIYVPDYLLNNHILIELKSKNHYLWTKDSENNRFEKEIKSALEYCKNHNWEFKIIYDTDIGFKSDKYKKYLLSHPEIIEKYNIRFNKPLV